MGRPSPCTAPRRLFREKGLHHIWDKEKISCVFRRRGYRIPNCESNLRSQRDFLCDFLWKAPSQYCRTKANVGAEPEVWRPWVSGVGMQWIAKFFAAVSNRNRLTDQSSHNPIQYWRVCTYILDHAWAFWSEQYGSNTVVGTTSILQTGFCKFRWLYRISTQLLFSALQYWTWQHDLDEFFNRSLLEVAG